MRGLVPRIPVILPQGKTWMAATGPAMTASLIRRDRSLLAFGPDQPEQVYQDVGSEWLF
ncbi:MAG TPA: hypothetical protein VIK79_08800 [Xanthobacteraceae bacterium]